MSALRPAVLVASAGALAAALIGWAAAGFDAFARDTDAPGADSARAAEAPARTGLVSVSDGDSFVVVDTQGARRRIRISGIDAPEHGQPHADESRAHLQELLGSGELHIQPIKTDPFDRVVANVFAGEVDVGLAMVEAGMAWHFKRYAKDQDAAQRERYAAAERRARHARIGLWSARQPVAPWTWRAQNPRPGKRQAAPAAVGAASDILCRTVS